MEPFVPFASGDRPQWANLASRLATEGWTMNNLEHMSLSDLPDEEAELYGVVHECLFSV